MSLKSFLKTLLWLLGCVLLGPFPLLASAQLSLTMLHPEEGAKLPTLKQIFVYGAATPGATLTINDHVILLHPKGGYLAMLPVQEGPNVLHCRLTSPQQEPFLLDRQFTVEEGRSVMPADPLAINNGSLFPSDDQVLAVGDLLKVSFQGSPGGTAEFSFDNGKHFIPMTETGFTHGVYMTDLSSAAFRGLYEGAYVIQPGDKAENAPILISFKNPRHKIQQTTPGRLSIDSISVPQIGLVSDDSVPVRTAAQGGYDFFLYKGMQVRLTGRVGKEWRIPFGNDQSGWIKEGTFTILPPGTGLTPAFLSTVTVSQGLDSELIRLPLGAMIPYRTEQTLTPARLTLTLYGCTDQSPQIRDDPADTLLRQIEVTSVSPGVCQLQVTTTLRQWWGYDVRYEGTDLVLEIREPWTSRYIRGMVIALDPGHGGSDHGATGPLGTTEKEANLLIAHQVIAVLEAAGAKPFLTRDSDVFVPLLERGRIAWQHKARLFVSIHCNASGEGSNPVTTNGYSTYWNQPQSEALARAVHGYYSATKLPDFGLYYADLAVCRITQMPAILTEQAFQIVPAQEQMIFDPVFQRICAHAILRGILEFVRQTSVSEVHS